MLEYAGPIELVRGYAARKRLRTTALDPSENGGKVVPKVSYQGEDLRYEPNPTFLGITHDDQLTFQAHVTKLKVKMAKRRQCLIVMANRSGHTGKHYLQHMRLHTCNT